MWRLTAFLLVICHSQANNDAGKFLWLSDIHLDPFYGSSNAAPFSPDCLKSTAAPLGQVGCDAPLALVNATLTQALSTKPDFVIITGDFCRHYNDLLDSPVDATKTIIQNVSEMIRREFPNVPIIPSIGNNDVTPDYYVDLDRPNEMLDMLSEGFSPLLPFDGPGGYVGLNVSDTITVISLNTLLYSTNHVPPQPTPPDPLGQFAWLERQLQQSQGRKVLIIGHIPPTIGSFRHTQLWKESYVQRYFSLLDSYRDLVVGQLFGHIHSDEFRLHYGFPLYLASSVSPIYGSNPSYRVVTYSKDALLDSNVFFLNLSSTEWEKAPKSFAQAFGVVPDMSNLTSVIDNLKEGNLWDELLERQHVYTHGAEDCDETCRKTWMCTLESTTKSQWNDCLQNKGDWASPPPTTSTGTNPTTSPLTTPTPSTDTTPPPQSSSGKEISPRALSLILLILFSTGLAFVGLLAFAKRRRRHIEYATPPTHEMHEGIQMDDSEENVAPTPEIT